MRDEQELEPRPSLWDELLGNDHSRKDAVPKPKLTPGYYDDKRYTEEDEEGFGIDDFNRELEQIKRLKAIKFQQENNNNDR